MILLQSYISYIFWLYVFEIMYIDYGWYNISYQQNIIESDYIYNIKKLKNVYAFSKNTQKLCRCICKICTMMRQMNQKMRCSSVISPRVCQTYPIISTNIYTWGLMKCNFAFVAWWLDEGFLWICKWRSTYADSKKP